ncbi:MAG: hypothetical protein ACLTX6_09825 [Lachnospiraceae bacterium]
MTDYEDALRDGMKWKLQDKRHVLGLYLERYRGLSPLSKLNARATLLWRTARAGQSKTTVGIKLGDRMEISVTDGVIEVEVTGIRKETWET